jgi:hypothetical protein
MKLKHLEIEVTELIDIFYEEYLKLFYNMTVCSVS